MASTLYRLPLLWTTVIDDADGAHLVARGEISSATVSALGSLLNELRDTGDRRLIIDLTAADLLPGAETILERWGVVPGDAPGMFVFADELPRVAGVANA
jgi:hypothetical protein